MQSSFADDTMSLETFRDSIVATTPFDSIADLIPASDGYAVFAAQPGKQPLTFHGLKEFVASTDLLRFGLLRESVLCTSISNGPEAAVCFWAFADRCVFAPLNPALTDRKSVGEGKRG